MKKILLLIALIFSVSIAEAQQACYQRNDAAATAFAARNGQYSRAAVDVNGRPFTLVTDSTSGATNSIIPISNATALNGIGSPPIGFYKVSTNTASTGSTTTVIQSAAHGGKVGDYVSFYTGADNQMWSPILSVTVNAITVSNAFPTAPANGDNFIILRPQIIAASSPNSAGLGSLSVNLDYNNQLNPTLGLLKAEDFAHTNNDAGVGIFLVREDALTASTSTTNDYGNVKGDALNRLIVTNAPAGETFESCGTATAVTSDVAIKASVASNRMYVTSIDCKNTSTTVGPTLDFKDGSTIIAVGGIPATSATGLLTGEYHHTFPIPLRGTSATAFNFATNTATSSVTCCAQGYISIG